MDRNMQVLLRTLIDGHERTIKMMQGQVRDFEELLVFDEHQRITEGR